MTLRTIRFAVALILAISAGVAVSAWSNASRADDGVVEDAPQLDSSSPSQEARERINQIRRNEFFYQSFGRPDPFETLVGGDYEPLNAAEIADLNSARLVGVMWGDDDRFALVEDGDGYGYILRVGDRVRNGRVVSIRKNSLRANVTLYGITNTVILKLDKTED